MGKTGWIIGVVSAGAIGAGGVAVAPPAWASGFGRVESPSGCELYAAPPRAAGGTLSGYGQRRYCGDGDKVNYLWVRVMKHVAFFPDWAAAITNTTVVSNAELTAVGSCSGNGLYYTMTSDSRGNAVESDRRDLC